MNRRSYAMIIMWTTMRYIMMMIMWTTMRIHDNDDNMQIICISKDNQRRQLLEQ